MRMHIFLVMNTLLKGQVPIFPLYIQIQKEFG